MFALVITITQGHKHIYFVCVFLLSLSSFLPFFFPYLPSLPPLFSPPQMWLPPIQLRDLGDFATEPRPQKLFGVIRAQRTCLVAAKCPYEI